MGKCYCFVIDQRKDQFERARERRKRRRIRKILMAGKKLMQFTIAMILLMMMALGIFITLLAASDRVDISCIATAFIMFAVGGPIGEALMGGKE